jgi:lysyl-tRNA synthetase class I
MYFGFNYNVESRIKKVSFTCKCPAKLAFNDRCSTCGKSVKYIVQHEAGVKLKCPCGHSGTVRLAELSDMQRL